MEGKNLNAGGMAHVDEPMRKKPKLFPIPVKLSIGDTVILADKQTLIETSPYFASLFKFHADNNLDVVSLGPPENIDMVSFLAVLNSLSNMKLKLDISGTNLWDFIVVAKYLQLDRMEEECCTILRTMPLQLEMDDLCRMWRKGSACAFEKVTTLVVAAFSLRMGSVSQSSGFLDFSAEELVALLSDDAFLPLKEEDVCKAVNAWCEHDPKHRKNLDVLSPILAQVVWDDSANDLLAALVPQSWKPEKPPKRATGSETHQISSGKELDKRGINMSRMIGVAPYWNWLNMEKADENIAVGDHLYSLEVTWKQSRYMDDGGYGVSFYRTDRNTKQRTALASIGSKDGPEVESDVERAKYSLCHVKLSGQDKIGCFIAFWDSIGDQGGRILYKFTYLELGNTIGLYDTTTDAWQYLPLLPFPRIDNAMIQCGSFLYVIGGTECKPDRGAEGNAHHCYRLDLTKLTENAVWERIADLNTARIGHSARVQYGRIIVYGGQTEVKVDYAGRSCFEEACCSEAYDTTLNMWITFE